MQQEPDRRYQNTADMKHEVQTIRVARDPNARAPQPRAAGARKPVWLAATAAVLAAAAVFAWQMRNKDHGNTTTSREPARNEGTSSIKAPVASPAPENPVPKAVVVSPPKPEKEPGTAPASPPASSLPPVAEELAPKPVVVKPAPTEPAPSTQIAATTPTAPRPSPNPEMANAVAQLGPDPAPSNSTNSPPAAVLADWQRYAEQAEGLMKQRDPDAAIQAYEQAISSAEESVQPVSVIEIARLCHKMGSLEAALGSTAEARGSFEHGKRLIQQAKVAGKLPPDALHVLGEIEGSLRRLPRDE
jgi:hypothetical protein